MIAVNTSPIKPTRTKFIANIREKEVIDGIREKLAVVLHLWSTSLNPLDFLFSQAGSRLASVTQAFLPPLGDRWMRQLPISFFL